MMKLKTYTLSFGIALSIFSLMGEKTQALPTVTAPPGQQIEAVQEQKVSPSDLDIVIVARRPACGAGGGGGGGGGGEQEPFPTDTHLNANHAVEIATDEQVFNPGDYLIFDNDLFSSGDLTQVDDETFEFGSVGKYLVIVSIQTSHGRAEGEQDIITDFDQLYEPEFTPDIRLELNGTLIGTRVETDLRGGAGVLQDIFSVDSAPSTLKVQLVQNVLVLNQGASANISIVKLSNTP